VQKLSFCENDKTEKTSSQILSKDIPPYAKFDILSNHNPQRGHHHHDHVIFQAQKRPGYCCPRQRKQYIQKAEDNNAIKHKGKTTASPSSNSIRIDISP